jgi:hypothetical protein
LMKVSSVCKNAKLCFFGLLPSTSFVISYPTHVSARKITTRPI